MGNSIVGSEEQFVMLFKFERLKGSYDAFKILLEQCKLSYDHVQDELSIDHQAKAFEFLYNLVTRANKELVEQIQDMQENCSHLEGFSESIAPVIDEILEDLDSKIEDMGPVMDSLMDARMQGRNLKRFSFSLKTFLQQYGLW